MREKMRQMRERDERDGTEIRESDVRDVCV